MGLGQESASIYWIERNYMKHERKNIIVALEDLDFIWCEEEVKEVIEMWERGIPLDMIASNFDRDQDEVAILIMHLARKNQIKPRVGGIFGGVKNEHKGLKTV